MTWPRNGATVGPGGGHMGTDRESVRVYLDPDLAAWLRAEAARRRTSASAVVREILAREAGR